MAISLARAAKSWHEGKQETGGTIVSSTETEYPLAMLTVEHPDGDYDLAVDRVAVHEKTIKMISVSGPQAAVKGFGGWLYDRTGKVRTTLGGVRFLRGTEAATAWDGDLNRPRADPAGYRRHTHHLGLGTHQAVWVSKDPDFLLSLSEAAIWRLLASERFTTPVVRQWTRWIGEALYDEGLIQRCWCHRCDCGIVTATTADLDEVVCGGIRSGDLRLDDWPGPTGIPYQDPIDGGAVPLVEAGSHVA